MSLFFDPKFKIFIKITQKPEVYSTKPCYFLNLLELISQNHIGLGMSTPPDFEILLDLCMDGKSNLQGVNKSQKS